STSWFVWRVPRWSASPRSGGAPAAPEANSCSPVICGSPRARTRCSASGKLASVWCPGAVRWRDSRLVGRGPALEMLLVADDLDGPRAEQYGYVNRLIADNQLDAEVAAIASRLARFDHDAIARTKAYVDQVTLGSSGSTPTARSSGPSAGASSSRFPTP